MLGKLITSPKLIQSNNQLLFPNDDTENIPKNQYLTPNDFYEIQNTTKSKQLYIHLNISSISYHIDDLVSLITNCKTKPKVIGISESRMRISATSISDHLTQFLLVPGQLTGVQPHKVKEKRSFHNFHPKAFEKDIENIDSSNSLWKPKPIIPTLIKQN